MFDTLRNMTLEYTFFCNPSFTHAVQHGKERKYVVKYDLGTQGNTWLEDGSEKLRRKSIEREYNTGGGHKRQTNKRQNSKNLVSI